MFRFKFALTLTLLALCRQASAMPVVPRQSEETSTPTQNTQLMAAIVAPVCSVLVTLLVGCCTLYYTRKKDRREVKATQRDGGTQSWPLFDTAPSNASINHHHYHAPVYQDATHLPRSPSSSATPSHWVDDSGASPRYLPQSSNAPQAPLLWTSGSAAAQQYFPLLPATHIPRGRTADRQGVVWL